MSVVFVVAPVVVAGWPILCGAVAGAAGALGYKILKSENCEDLRIDDVEDTSSVEVQLEGSRVIADQMKRDSRFSITNGDVTATFSRSIDGGCTVHVSGRDRTQEQLSEIGRQILGQVAQQYAYNKVVTELKTQGFSVTQESIAADQTIRIRVSKYV